MKYIVTFKHNTITHVEICLIEHLISIAPNPIDISSIEIKKTSSNSVEGTYLAK